MVFQKAISVLLLLFVLLLEQASSECISDYDCSAIYHPNSKCTVAGVCSNPYVSGCLHSFDSDKHKMRVCNADDLRLGNHETKNGMEQTCRIAEFQYPEIRVHNQDWEVAIFLSWIMQIYLTEFLEVPASVGLGDDTFQSSFYSTDTGLPLSRRSYSFDALVKANELGGDCSLTEEDCVHVIPDVWLGQKDTLLGHFDDGDIDYLDGNGQVGKISWYVPKKTAQEHPFTITYVGMDGRRQELADIFKRPTSWQDYCHEVSTMNCSQPDGIASRYPVTDSEKASYFAPNGNYIGHFRHTQESNCTILNEFGNSTCTGHIVNAPCTWSTFLDAQTYWNDIPLASSGTATVNSGYTYSQMLQVWDAANATNEHVMMWWYEPDPLLEAFRGTDYEFTKVHLPSPSVECRESRVTPDDRCSADTMTRRGSKEGSCDNIGHTTKKAIASSLRDSTRATPEVDQSPGYYAIRNFNIDDLDLAVVLRDYVKKGKTGQSARESVCEWVQNNMDVLGKFKPVGYPRTLRNESETQRNLKTVAQGVGIFAAIYVLISFLVTYHYRKARIMVFAQVQFVFIMLFGLLLVALSSIMHAALTPDNTTCLAQVWFVNLGYTCLLGPLIIKVSAINQLMRASRRMRRVRIKPRTLYLQVAALASFVTIFLLVWTFMDPPRPEMFRILVDDGRTVSAQATCSSEDTFWVTGYHFWEGFLILWAFVLAFQSRGVKAEFNESRAVGTMIYSHFVFAALRVIVYLTFDEEPNTNAVATSLLLSLDVISALTIYLLPKWVKGHKQLHKPASNENTRFQITASSFRREGSTTSVTGLNLTNKSNPNSNNSSVSKAFLPSKQLPKSHSTFSYFDDQQNKRKSFDSIPESTDEEMSGSFGTSDQSKYIRRVSFKTTSEIDTVRQHSMDRPLSGIEESSRSGHLDEATSNDESS
ncbi:unnamed protein product [Cylindrotheca closterium]|uniref:G-protein coupled receptors family 3 profile domain-containing protein n=1 Tax=Cylindrotheca closterium TaxID=2856 RepID=A0AAD2GAS9_9STRA|nr:unnamed protein product [Cylindrotheca closterium]